KPSVCNSLHTARAVFVHRKRTLLTRKRSNVTFPAAGCWRVPQSLRSFAAMPFEALKWSHSRPNALVVACSDGRLQEATDEFLAREFRITRYDRFYVPGGAGALASSSVDH